MPTHAHYFNQNTNVAGEHTHTEQALQLGSGVDGGPNLSIIDRQTNPAGNHEHNVQGPTDSRGSSQAHENRPPYYALCFIQKV